MSRIFIHLSKLKIKHPLVRAVPRIYAVHRSYSVYNTPLINQLVVDSCRYQHFTSQLIEHNLWKCYSHSSQSVATPRKYTADKILSKLQDKSVSFRYIDFNDVLSSISSLKSNELTCLQNCSALVNFSNEQKEKLVEAIWTKIMEKGQPPSMAAMLALLKAYRNIGKSVDDPKVFLSKYPTVEADPKIYDELLYLACAICNQSLVDKILGLIKENGWSLTECGYNALILNHSKNGSIEKCEEVLKNMHEANVQPSSETYKELIKAFIQNNDKKNAVNALNEHGKEITSYQLLDIIRSAISTAAADLRSDIIPVALEVVHSAIINSKLFISELENICIEILYMNKSVDRLDYDPYDIIIKNLPVPLFINEDHDCYGVFLLKEIISKQMSSKILVEFCDKLIASKRNKRALHMACAVAFKTQSSVAVDLLKELSKREPLRAHYFWPLFYKATKESEVFDIIQLASEMKTVLEVDTILDHIFPKIEKTLYNSSVAMKILDDNGLQSGNIKAAMLIYLLKKKKPIEALQLAETYLAKVSTEILTRPVIDCILTTTKEEKHLFQLTKLIKAIASARGQKSIDWPAQILCEIATIPKEGRNNFSTVFNLVKNYKTIDLKMSKTGVDCVMALISKHRSVAAQCHTILQSIIDEKFVSSEIDKAILTNTNETFEELESHLCELQAKNLNTRGVLRRLYLLAVRQNRVERALELRMECNQADIVESAAMLSITVELMTKTKDLESAQKALEDLKQHFPKFTIDDFKIIDLAKLFVEQNQFDGARKLLEEHAKTSKPRFGDHVLKNVCELLDTTAKWAAESNASENVTESFLNFLVNLGYCSHNNKTLGPVIKEYFNKNDLIGAVIAFINITEMYKVTPNQVALMAVLIDASNNPETQQKYSLSAAGDINNYLRNVIDACKAVHKSTAVNTNLLVAFALTGTEQQLRKLLMNPNFTFDAEQLTKNLIFQSYFGKVSAVIKLARSTRGLNHEKILEQNLYNLLLDNLIRANDCNGATELLDEISSDISVKLPKRFLANISNLFSKNNLEIPSKIKSLSTRRIS